MPKHQSLKLSPIKTILSKSSLPSLWGEGPWGSRERKAHTRGFGSLSRSHLIQTVEGDTGRSTPHPHLGQGQRGHLWGQVTNHGSPGRGGPESGGWAAIPSLHISAWTSCVVHMAPFIPKSLY